MPVSNTTVNFILNTLSFQEYQKIVDAEWGILYDKLDKMVQSGAKIILSKLPIGDVATQYFADRYYTLRLSSGWNIIIYMSEM